MTVAITRTDLTSRELRAVGSRSYDARAARRMVAVALVPESADRKSAAANCGMDRRPLRDWLHRYDEGGLEGLAGRRGVTPLLDGARALRVPDNITAAAAPRSTDQPRRKRPGLPARQQDRHLRLQLIPRHRRPLLQSLERLRQQSRHRPFNHNTRSYK